MRGAPLEDKQVIPSLRSSGQSLESARIHQGRGGPRADTWAPQTGRFLGSRRPRPRRPKGQPRLLKGRFLFWFYDSPLSILVSPHHKLIVSLII